MRRYRQPLSAAADEVGEYAVPALTRTPPRSLVQVNPIQRWLKSGYGVIMVSMGTVHGLHQPEAIIWRASIVLGIGDDDTVCGVDESDHATEEAAREWVARELPRAEFPAWVAQRPHGVAGAFLYGGINLGYLTAYGDAEPTWEPDIDAPSWDADLVDGVLHWHPHD